MQKIDGSEFSNYKVTAIQIGQAKSEGLNGKKSRYIVLFVKNKKSRLAAPRHLIIFEDEEPELINILMNYKTSNTKNAKDRYTIDLKAFEESDDANAMDGLLEFPGMQTVQYKLKKGLCYMNDVNGNRVFKKNSNQAIMTDTITVLVQIDYAVESDGKMEVHYFDKFDPDTQGQRMENAFYREAVETNVSTTAPTVVDNNETDEQPF